jgi:hypothetical protein
MWMSIPVLRRARLQPCRNQPAFNAALAAEVPAQMAANSQKARDLETCEHLRQAIGRRNRLLFRAREHKAGLAPIHRRMVDLLPEPREVIRSRNERNQRREIDGRRRDPVNRDDKPADLPLVPAIVQDGGNYRKNLDDSLQLTQIAGLNGEAFGALGW